MSFVAVVARQDFSYRGRQVAKGEVFGVSPTDAIVLHNAGRVSFPPDWVKVPAEVAKPKRQYRRRDLESEDSSEDRRYLRRDLEAEDG
jgi:hypothetical protein